MKASSHSSDIRHFPELFRISNLFSLFRIAIIPVLWYYLSRPDNISRWIALSILIAAGISDGLDGYLARKLNQVSKLGMMLDPLADKILAGSLVVMLIWFRDFPIWLAGLIIGRDLLILGAAAALLREKNVVVSSNITGKYAFFFIAVLLACAVIRFEFGVALLTYISTALIFVSIVIYARSFVRIKRGESAPAFIDSVVYRTLRIGLAVIILLILLAKLYLSL